MAAAPGPVMELDVRRDDRRDRHGDERTDAHRALTTASRRGPLAVVALAALVAVGCTAGATDGTGDAHGEDALDATADGELVEEPTALDPGSDLAAGGVADLVDAVAPATVSIEVTVEQGGLEGQAEGSGVIWAADGIVVTNAHVVAPAEEVEVVLADGSRYDADPLAADARTDLAVLGIDADGLPTAEFGDRLPRIGEPVVALGNPLGFQNTATSGIVSGVDRSLPILPDAPPLAGLIQTDAAISSGNSGGALVDGSGAVVGINVAAVDDDQLPGGIAEGLAFAIPATTVIPVVEQLLEDGEVAHASLGVHGTELTPQLTDEFGIDQDRGVLIGEVLPGGAADAAGLEQGEIVIELGDAPIDGLGDLFGALQRAAPGDTVPVTLVGPEGERTVEVTLEEPPEEG